MRYVSKLIDIEAEQWDAKHLSASEQRNYAEHIVAWVNANGGEARFHPNGTRARHTGEPRIAVHTINGWAIAEPGHYVVMGEATFESGPGKPGISERTLLRDFYPCDPETFERRWEPIS